MHVNSRRWIRLEGQPTKRKAHLPLIRQKRKRREEHSDSQMKNSHLSIIVQERFFQYIHQCGQNFSLIFSVVSVESKSFVQLFLNQWSPLQNFFKVQGLWLGSRRESFKSSNRIQASLSLFGKPKNGKQHKFYWFRFWCPRENLCNLQCLNKSAFQLQLKVLRKEANALKHNVHQRACQQGHEVHADVSSSNLLDIAVSYDGEKK